MMRLNPAEMCIRSVLREVPGLHGLEVEGIEANPEKIQAILEMQSLKDHEAASVAHWEG
jgi:hypothetical protein